jgi:hypothetical protein
MNGDKKPIGKPAGPGLLAIDTDVFHGEEHEHEEQNQSHRGRRFPSAGTGRRG